MRSVLSWSSLTTSEMASMFDLRCSLCSTICAEKGKQMHWFIRNIVNDLASVAVLMKQFGLREPFVAMADSGKLYLDLKCWDIVIDRDGSPLSRLIATRALNLSRERGSLQKNATHLFRSKPACDTVETWLGEVTYPFQEVSKNVTDERIADTIGAIGSVSAIEDAIRDAESDCRKAHFNPINAFGTGKCLDYFAAEYLRCIEWFGRVMEMLPDGDDSEICRNILRPTISKLQRCVYMWSSTRTLLLPISPTETCHRFRNILATFLEGYLLWNPQPAIQ